MALPRTIPWWGWLLIVLGLLSVTLVSTALVIRERGWDELNALTERIRAEGRGLTPADLVAEAPVVDAARQERAWALVGATSLYPEIRTKTWGMVALEPSAKDLAKLAQESARVMRDSAACRLQWRDLHASGPVVLSLLGWLKHDLPEPEQAGISKMAACRIPCLLAMRQVANAFATEARLAPDPRPALTELDALVGSCAPNGSIIDAMIAIAVSTIRDEAWLEAATRGHDQAPWVAHLPDYRLAALRRMRAERLTFGGGFYLDVQRGTSLPFARPTSAGLAQEMLSNCAGFLYSVIAPQDIGLDERWMLAGEDRGRTHSGSFGALLPELMTNRWLHPISSISLPNLTESVIAGTQADLNARRVRLTALLAYALRQGPPCQRPRTTSAQKPKHCPRRLNSPRALSTNACPRHASACGPIRSPPQPNSFPPVES
jgi:hypothetical protein